MEKVILDIVNLNAYYGKSRVLKNVFLSIPEKKVTVLMGSSGCGKSTLIRCVNRLHELIPDAYFTGKVLLRFKDIREIDRTILRRKIGMVFQAPNPFPNLSIHDNVIAGYKLNGVKLEDYEKEEIVETALRKAGLWKEVKDRLDKSGTHLSVGQQQRLCIARAIAVHPDIILLDEPTYALDPKSTDKVERMIEKLKEEMTVLFVTHHISQASRISDYAAFLYLGELIEFAETQKLFITPRDRRTEEYLTRKKFD